MQQTSKNASHSTSSKIILLTILWLAWFLRLYQLDFQELRGDESFGYFFSLRSFADIVQSTFALQEPHPVASYFIQYGWLGWAGHSEFALRFLGVCWGVLAVALLFRLARTLDFSLRSATLAVFFLTISPYAIWHSQDARMYSMSLALTVATIGLALEFSKRHKLSFAIAYVFVGLLALHTHYYVFYVLLAFYLLLLLRGLLIADERATLLRLLIPTLLIAVLYLPWLIQASATLQAYRGNGDSPSFSAMLTRSLSVFAVGETTPLGQRTLWAALVGIALLCSLLLQWHAKPPARRTLWLLLTYFTIPLLLTWLGAIARPIFNERYLLPLIAPFLLLIATGSDHWRFTQSHPSPHRQPVILSSCHLVTLFALLLGMIFSLNRNYHDPAYSKTTGWRELAATMVRSASGFAPEQVRLAQNFPDPTLWFYTGTSIAHLVLPPAAQDQKGADHEAEQLAATGVARVVLAILNSPTWDENENKRSIAQQALDQTYRQVARSDHPQGALLIYDRPLVPLHPLAVEFVNGVTLRGFATAPSMASAGSILTIYLGWQGEATQLNGSEKVTVQLLNGAGQLVAQQDQSLSPKTVMRATVTTELYPISLPIDLAVGNYRLLVGLYDPAQNSASRISTADGKDAVELGEIKVIPAR